MDEEYAWLTPEEAAKLLILKPGETQDTPIRFPPPKPWEEQSYAERQWRLEQRQRRADQATFDDAVNKVADMIRREKGLPSVESGPEAAANSLSSLGSRSVQDGADDADVPDGGVSDIALAGTNGTSIGFWPSDDQSMSVAEYLSIREPDPVPANNNFSSARNFPSGFGQISPVEPQPLSSVSSNGLNVGSGIMVPLSASLPTPDAPPNEANGGIGGASYVPPASMPDGSQSANGNTGNVPRQNSTPSLATPANNKEGAYNCVGLYPPPLGIGGGVCADQYGNVYPQVGFSWPPGPSFQAGYSDNLEQNLTGASGSCGIGQLSVGGSIYTGDNNRLEASGGVGYNHPAPGSLKPGSSDFLKPTCSATFGWKNGRIFGR